MGGVCFFVSFRIVFSDNTRVRIFFFCRVKREFFFQNLTLGYMTKTLNQIIFFFLHQNQNIFFSNIGNQNIFLEKKPYPPSFKLNGRSLIHFICLIKMNQKREKSTLIVYAVLCVLYNSLDNRQYVIGTNAITIIGKGQRSKQFSI